MSEARQAAPSGRASTASEGLPTSQADACKGRQAKYETVYILRADMTDEVTKKATEKANDVVGKFKGEIESLKDLGKRPLAYRIEKQMKGHYFQLNFKGSGQVVEELERHLRLSEEVIRFLTVVERKSRGVPA